ncbi:MULTISPECIES: autoinducer-binding transcriptional regulator TraR [unclassified Rhizobium]|uniref:autoinducer-binding transcriptional regulator TraR n=1 Tax=unclassified Rhizobium TaxID=2613769 RepID=UPI001ADC68C5|nr:MULTISPECIES: transcriptional regulator TraR [unclassified Rhizobium]MBO9101916.1 transcriptional regulator TraR [Rhizobium sp. L58/93]MBO9172087.1 transcriptional regulator TraR [Rhizobium sp. L245/93]QXZ88305.1 transcriptional regulator TraR [Rhizobium sp. K1/93]QXZ94276.1 transcriptional regulator TraR [Rhizobium sp. K15/93]QYA05635.1 transcriptional regulator TraR [Rhizobium sp. B21/90]
MQHWLDSMTDLSAIKGDEKIVKQALAHLTKQAGFQGYAYLHIQPGYTIAASNYHPDWREKYFRQNFAAVDPVVKRAKSLKQLFIWSGEQNRHHLSKAERAFYAEAADFGIRSGITIPVKAANGSTAIFTLASEKTAVELERDIDCVAAAAAVGQLHTRMSFLPLTPDVQYPAWLDPKEAAYLNWISVGKTMEEAADLEGVKYNSVKSKLEEARKRFEIHTMPHLVALAIRAGLI